MEGTNRYYVGAACCLDRLLGDVDVVAGSRRAGGSWQAEQARLLGILSAHHRGLLVVFGSYRHVRDIFPQELVLVPGRLISAV